MLESLLNLLHHRRWITLTLGLLLLAASVWNMRNLSINDRPERWMPKSAVESFEIFSRHFESGDTIVMGFEFEQGVKDEDLEHLKTVRADLEKVHGVARVIDPSIAAELVENTPLTELLKTPPPGQYDPYALYRGLLFDDPRVWRMKTRDSEGNNCKPHDVHPSEENRTLLVVVETDVSTDPALSPQAQNEQLDERRRKAVAGIYRVLKKHERSDITVHSAGALIIQYELERIARGIAMQLVPPALLLMMISLGVGFRSVWAILIAILGGGWAVAVLLGGVVYCGWSVNVVTVGAPILMIVITLSSTVHFAHYHAHHPMRAGGSYAREHRNHFVRWVAVPCCGAALTTGFGFLMLSFNELEPIRELGVELFIGSVCAFLGAYLVWLALPSCRAAPGRMLSGEKMQRMGRMLTTRPVLVVVFAIPLMAAMGYFSTQGRVDADPFSFFEKENRVAQALTHFSQRKFGHYMLDVVLIPKDRPSDPAQREAARQEDQRIAYAFEKEIEKRPEVRRVISESYVRQRVKEITQEPPPKPQEKSLRQRLQVIANHEALKVKRVAVLQHTFRNWLIDLKDEGATRITLLVYDPGTGFRPLLNAVRSELKKVGGADRFEVCFTGTAASVAVLSEELVGATARGLIAAMTTMALVCIVLFRSLRLMLIAFLPNVFPILTVFGVMGLFGVPLNSGSAMVATIALGVGLNDTVHFVMHYRRRKEQESINEAVSDSFREITRPLVLTSLVNCAGFAIFLLSEFRPTHHFGLLASIAMAAALVGDLVLLPNLLKIFDRKR